MNFTPRNWFVAQVRPNGLKRARTNLSRQGFSVFAPQERHGRGRLLFPGYLFVQFDPDTPGWTRVNNTLGISRLVVNGRARPRPLPAGWMAGLLRRCDAEGRLLPPDDLGAGDRVRVVAGPFADLVLTIESLDHDGRVRALFDIMGRTTAVSLDPDCLMRA